MKNVDCRAQALSRAGLGGGRAPLMLRQVHGAKVVTIREGETLPGAPAAGLSAAGAAREETPSALIGASGAVREENGMRTEGVRAAPLASQSAKGTAREEDGLRADGWVSTVRGLPVAVYVADCPPVFLWDRELEAVAVIHAGWKGLAAGVLRAAVEAFRAIGVPARRLSAAIGPHAGPCCYRVGPELRKYFRAESFIDGPGAAGAGREENVLRLDLGAEAQARLVEAGLEPGSVRICADCTICGPEHFFSYRRDKMDRRILAFLARPS